MTYSAMTYIAGPLLIDMLKRARGILHFAKIVFPALKLEQISRSVAQVITGGTVLVLYSK